MNRLVSVIVPAWNAGATIDATLTSARAQSYRDLEIIVVDDGSRDDTVARVRAHAALDPRVRLIEQQNAGVAAARNTAIAAAQGSLVAPLDADDLWRSDKIALQVARLDRAGDDTGLAYCWFALIDGEDRILLCDPPRHDEGDVRIQMCRRNLVGNGSSPLIRRAVLDRIGGYDPSLRARGGQGCEDYDLYLRIAAVSHFAVVPDILVGYRQTPTNMSSDGRQLVRSRLLSTAAFEADHPEYGALFRRGHSRILRFHLMRSLRLRQWPAARELAVAFVRAGRRAAFAELVDGVRGMMLRNLTGRRGRYAIGRSFPLTP